MACLNTLKEEIKILESVFPKSHDRFQIHFATMDELCCKFVGSCGKTYEINANITVIRFLDKMFVIELSKVRTFIIRVQIVDYNGCVKT